MVHKKGTSRRWGSPRQKKYDNEGREQGEGGGGDEHLKRAFRRAAHYKSSTTPPSPHTALRLEQVHHSPTQMEAGGTYVQGEKGDHTVYTASGEGQVPLKQMPPLAQGGTLAQGSEDFASTWAMVPTLPTTASTRPWDRASVICTPGKSTCTGRWGGGGEWECEAREMPQAYASRRVGRGGGNQ